MRGGRENASLHFRAGLATIVGMVPNVANFGESRGGFGGEPAGGGFFDMVVPAAALLGDGGGAR